MLQFKLHEFQIVSDALEVNEVTSGYKSCVRDVFVKFNNALDEFDQLVNRFSEGIEVDHGILELLLNKLAIMKALEVIRFEHKNASEELGGGCLDDICSQTIRQASNEMLKEIKMFQSNYFKQNRQSSDEMTRQKMIDYRLQEFLQASYESPLQPIPTLLQLNLLLSKLSVLSDTFSDCFETSRFSGFSYICI